MIVIRHLAAEEALVAADPDLRAEAISALDFWTPLMLRAAADAGVVTAFGMQRRSSRAVAEETGLHPDTLRRVLRALAARGIFYEDDDGEHFALTEVGRVLLPEHPASVWYAVNWHPWALHAWAEFSHTLRTGEAAFLRHHGASFFDYLAADEQAGAKFDSDMRRRTTALLDLAIPLFDSWPAEGTVVDVGGGTGALLSRLLRDRPGLRGVLFDQPDVLERAVEVLAAAGVADRVEQVAGDFFVDIPSGHNLYVMASVLHDWDDEHAGRILERCAAAMPPHGRLLLFEGVLRGPNEPDTFKNLDLHMAVLLGGRERSPDEWEDLLTASGFRLSRIVPTPGLAWIEAYAST